MSEPEPAVIKVAGTVRSYKFRDVDLGNSVLCARMVTQMLKALEAPDAPWSDIDLKLTSDANPTEDLEITADDILSLTATCVKSGVFSTSLGRVVVLSLATGPPRRTAPTTVSRAEKGFTSHWKVCLRWCSAMRKVLLQLPEELRGDGTVAECCAERIDTQFILKKHITGLNKAVNKVCFSDLVCGRAGVVMCPASNNVPRSLGPSPFLSSCAGERRRGAVSGRKISHQRSAEPGAGVELPRRVLEAAQHDVRCHLTATPNAV